MTFNLDVDPIVIPMTFQGGFNIDNTSTLATSLTVLLADS